MINIKPTPAIQPTYISSDEMRNKFSDAMSKMYQAEVPQYGKLLELVKYVNDKTLKENPALRAELDRIDNLNRLSEERHGAIRLGKPEELRIMGQIFNVMGMHPVHYYDLSIADIPVHSTAFRPIDNDSLKNNPFRVFTSLLRTDLIKDPQIRLEVEEILAKRDIFTPAMRYLLKTHHRQGGLRKEQAKLFIEEALEIFRWHQEAKVSKESYDRFHKTHRLVADIVSFQGPHINHLTPRTLDIDMIQKLMPSYGINPKAVIEGPPNRKIPILLRQTSFKALEEEVKFKQKDGSLKTGVHTARFGEIEYRGAALTKKGQALYDKLLNKTRAHIKPAPDGSNANEYINTLIENFKEFPDDLYSLYKQGLIHVKYYVTQKGKNNIGKLGNLNLDNLIDNGYIGFSPITYEDFLPFSAAGIFSSNLGDDKTKSLQISPNQQAFERALGMKILDPFDMYAAQEARSLIDSLDKLNVRMSHSWRAELDHIINKDPFLLTTPNIPSIVA
ncbi:MAG: VOC family protein [Pseudomonadota bacterium]